MDSSCILPVKLLTLSPLRDEKTSGRQPGAEIIGIALS